jgi:hypothetical protein
MLAVRAAGTSPPATSEDSSLGDEEEEESDRGQAPLRGGSLRPLTESSARHREVYRRGGARRGGAGAHRGGIGASRGGVWERDGGDVGRGLSTHRALEEEEAGLLHPEVGRRSSRRPVFERREFNLSDFAFAGWG